MNPEAKAREIIDKMLSEAGYVIQNRKDFNPSAALGVAVREYLTNSGPADYILYIDGSIVGVIEAKAEDKGVHLIPTADQSKRYATCGFKYEKDAVIRFTYESTGALTHFCDYLDVKERSRKVFSFHRPEYLAELLKDGNTLRNRMKAFPPLDTLGLRDCQIEAILNLEESFSENKPRALIQMATGAGKTFTAITSIYRLLKHAKVKRVLFLVDTISLGEQAESAFLNYKPTDDGRLFPELYNVLRLHSSFIPIETIVSICTIQRMFSILRGHSLDESEEQTSMFEEKITCIPREVKYNRTYPPEFFDVIIIDECHRSIYNVWRQVLEYFDAFLVGLTATPDNRTYNFFHENVVSEYTHEQAVLDNVNVGLTGTYVIETKVGSEGGVIRKQTVEKRNRLSRRNRWERMDNDFDYSSFQLDREVVNHSHIRAVVKEFRKSVLSQLFPWREEVPKTLLFAKTDSHADDIIKIIREEFGEGNEFCKKLTYASPEDTNNVLNAFRNDYYPRIAVTVDMIATGIDVKPVECLIFMRDVRSKNYFEQMLGRATRTLDYENLHRVSPSAKSAKLGFIVVDAVGVTKSMKITSRQLERKEKTTLKELMEMVAHGAQDDDTLVTLAGRLTNLDKIMTPAEKEKFRELCGEESINLGITLENGTQVPCSDTEISPAAIAKTLFKALDVDIVTEVALKEYGIDDSESLTDEQLLETTQQIAIAALAPFKNPKLRNFLEGIFKKIDQIVDNDNLDQVTFSGWDKMSSQQAVDTIYVFDCFINDNKNQIDALEVIDNGNIFRRPLMFRMVETLNERLDASPANLNTEKLWMAYSKHQSGHIRSNCPVNKPVDIVSMVRFQLGKTNVLQSFADSVYQSCSDLITIKDNGYFQFSEEQIKWVLMFRDHIATSINVTLDDLDFTPFDAKGGRGKFYQLFGSKYDIILQEINYLLQALT
ncbi:MAG: DEAD/DEAH box helicase family protein [Deltaproteobacteria bacterium]|jgi:type I restriction enzyme R subunit|nr:DEAD/DEAH box helicase family protein [Deltaproteobacteria bacterium]